MMMNEMMTAIQQGGTTVLIQFTLARDIVRVLLRERICNPQESPHSGACWRIRIPF